ncbi:MAG TPA: nucleotide exchange factor GrpE [Acidimicrobiales bacterium]|nr:nucleotide exchange factor GrpE [Acidimicrobiales bacterium]
MPPGSKGKGSDAEGFDRIKARVPVGDPTPPADAASPPGGAGSGAAGTAGAGESGSGAAGPAGAGEAGVGAAAGDGIDDVLEVEMQAAEVVETDLAALLETARRERDEYLDLSRRVQADFENYKKRMLREQTNLIERAAERLVGSLLPVVDAFDLAQAHMNQGAEFSPEGKALVQAASLLADTLAKEGLERIDAVGAVFDPTVHEAVEHLPAGDGDADATGGPVVVEALRAGYRWKDRVLRPAMVRVRG